MTISGKIKVFIIDDHELVRQGLRTLISSEDDLEVCGEAANVCQAKQLKQSIEPDLAVIDISLPDGSGLDLINNLHQWRPEMRIIVLSMYDDELFAERALNSGAMGYINKQDSANKLLEAIRQVLDNKVYVSPKITDRLLKRFSNSAQNVNRSPVDLLSDREIQVFELIGNGKKTAEIAEQLNISVKTIETYRSNIKQKFNLTSSAELTRSAVLWSLENH
jgi:DNA-binding NarL/FixJ family response regulator